MRKKKKHEKQCQPTGISLSNMYFLNRNITLNYVFSYWDFGDLLKLYDTQGKCLICLTLVLILSAKDESYIFWIVFSGQSWTREQMIYLTQDSLNPWLRPTPCKPSCQLPGMDPVKSTETCLAFCYYVNNIVSKGHEFQAPSNYFVRILFWSLWEGENEIYTQRVALERSPQSSEKFMTYWWCFLSFLWPPLTGRWPCFSVRNNNAWFHIQTTVPRTHMVH